MRVEPEVEAVGFGIEAALQCGEGRVAAVFAEVFEAVRRVFDEAGAEEQALVGGVVAVGDGGLAALFDAVGADLPRRGEGLRQGLLECLVIGELGGGGDEQVEFVFVLQQGDFQWGIEVLLQVL